MNLDEDFVREKAHDALMFALEHGYSNDIIRPLLAATRGETRAHTQLWMGQCMFCGVVHPQEVLAVDDPAEVNRWTRPNDDQLRRVLEKQQFQTQLKAHLRDGLS